MLYKQIVLEWGRDTETGVWGKGYSPDNGEHFYVTDTTFGRKYRQNDVDGLWNNGLHEKVKEKVNQEITNTVEPAIKQADSAVAYANDAIEKSRVNSQAIVDINSAVSDAVSDAAVARSDGLRAWDAAQSNVDLIDLNYASASAAISSARTEAIAAADEAKASASAAQADIVAVRSDVAAVRADVTAAQSDVAVAKNDIAKAKSDATAGINAVKSDVAVAKSDIADAKTSLTSQAKSLSSYASQASAAGKDITTLKSQAGQFEQDMADTKGDVSQLKVSASSASAALSDAAGNISSLQASAKSYSAALSDTNSNVASVTATASELETKYADAAGDISQIKADAKGTAETIADAQGDIASLKKRADGFDTQFINAKSDIAVIQSDATGTKETLANTKSDVAVLQSRADGFDAKYADAAGDISQLQADAKGMTQTLVDAQGDIAKLKTRADGFDTEFASTNGDISKLQVDASGTKQTLTNAKSDIAVLQSRADGFDTKYSNVAGDINKLQVDASGMKQTLTDAQGNISTLQTTATGFKNTLTDAQGNISTLQSDVAGLKKTTSDHAGNIATLQADAKTLTSQMSSAQGDISTLKQTATSLDSKYEGVSGDLNNLKSQAQWVTVTDTVDLNNIKTPCHKFLKGVVTNAPNESAWWYLTVEGSEGNRITQTAIADQSNNRYTRRLADSWSAWVRDATQTDVTALSNRITTNSTQITQNKQAIALKADQTTVDKTNGTVQQLQSQLQVQADQIASKVSSSDLDAKGYATQTYTQTLVTQKANEWNLNLTSLKTDVNAIKTTGGGVNLLQGTRDFKQWGTSLSKVAVTNGQETFQAVTGTNPNAVPTDYDIISFNNLPLEKDTDYTASFWAKASENIDITSFLYDSGSNGNYYDGAVLNPATTDYKRFVVHFHNGNNNATPNFIPMRIRKPGVTVWLYGCMLEEGTVAHTWSPAPSDMATVTSVTNLSATVDGIQAQVFDKNGSSKITHLSDLIATKVSQGDYNAQITLLKNDIDLRVAKGNVVSQINQEAGGNTLIQVANGMGKLALNASSVVFSGSAFIPDAYITTLNADKLRFYDSSGNVATMSAGLEQYDDDKSNKTIVLQYSGGYEVHASDLLGSILTMHDNTIRLAVKANGMASSGNVDQYSGVYVMQHYAQLSNYRSNGSAPGIYITDDGYTIKGDSTGSGTKWGDLNITSPQIFLNSDTKCQINGVNAQFTLANKWSTLYADSNLWLETKNTQVHLGDNTVDIANKNNSNTSNYDVHLTVRGWATFTGWVNCLGLTQTSRLSTKTNIERLDTARALELINSADVATYQYKQDVANGGTKRHASVIIDDVNDVARYQTPDEFISEDRSGRNDGDIVGYLMGAVQELTKKFKTLESKVG